MPAPTQIHVRMYQVGFGDCFLLSLAYEQDLDDGRRERHVLFDFGSTNAPKDKIPQLLPTIATKIAEHCHGQLDAIVVTHRHKDHISGFGNAAAAKTIDKLKPRLIARPWTENPSLPDNALGLTADSPAAAQRTAALGEAQQLAVRVADVAKQGRRRLTGMAADLAALADNQLRNKAAIDNLQRWADAGEAEYLHAGARSKLAKLLPGVKVSVLGPPTVEQEPDVVKERANSPEYWLRQQGLVSGLVHPLDALRQTDAISAAASPKTPPGSVRWLLRRMDRQRLASMLRLVHTLDSALNNTSVILMLDIGDKRLLFPGDAQIENWSYILEHAKNRQHVLNRLKDVDLYKVGHHGSRNATPRSLFEKYWGADRDPERPMVGLMSTRAGVHGKSEATAVPRATLVAALKRRMVHFYSTDTDLTADELFLEVTAPATGNEVFTRLV